MIIIMMQPVSMVKWNVNGITQFCNSHRESGLSILKKVNHSVNGKTYNGYDLSVACFNDSKEAAKNLHFNELKFKNQATGTCWRHHGQLKYHFFSSNFNQGTGGNESLIRNHEYSSKLLFKVNEYLSTEKAFFLITHLNEVTKYCFLCLSSRERGSTYDKLYSGLHL